MQTLSLTQQYLLCALNRKGRLPAYDHRAIACFVISAMLELLQAGCVTCGPADGRLRVCAALPAELAYLQPLYDEICRRQPVALKKLAANYTISFSDQKLQALFAAVAAPLQADAVLREAPASPLRLRPGYLPQAEILTRIRDALCAALHGREPLSAQQAALLVLLEKGGQLKRLFSQQDLKLAAQRLAASRDNAAATAVAEVVRHIDALAAAMLASGVVSSL